MAHVAAKCGCLLSVLQTHVDSAGEYLRCHLEAILVSIVWAASEGFVWVCGPTVPGAVFVVCALTEVT